MKKLLGLLSAASLIATTGASVVSCGFVSRTSNSDDTNGNDEKDDWSKDLIRIIINVDLGNLTEKQYKDKDFILKRTLEKNPGLDINELVVSDNTELGATISAKEGSKIYKGRTTVIYNLGSHYTELKDVITETNFRTYFKQFKWLHFSKNKRNVSGFKYQPFISTAICLWQLCRYSCQ
jgi:hypothetical protein